MIFFHRLFRQPMARVIALYAVLISAVAAIFIGQSLVVGGGVPLMPVDDAYIHFQYARQAAEGKPFVYNDAQGATSGATSFLYPFALAVGHKLGFTELWLGAWAYLIALGAWLAASVAVRFNVASAGLPPLFANAVGAAVAIWGAFAWHAFSGMETVLVAAFVVLTFHTFDRANLRGFVFSASVLAMLRPEASVMAVIAAALYLIRDIRANGFQRAQALLLLPVLAAGIQPLANALIVGSASASGGQSKSLLGIVPFDLLYITQRVLENYARAWVLLLTGFAPNGIPVLPPLLGFVALVGLYHMARSPRWPTALLVLTWFVLILGAISTLDTAFWHFNRYLMPLLILVFPLAARDGVLGGRAWQVTLVLWMCVSAAALNIIYADLQRVNLVSVREQPLKMAQWVAENLPSDALIAVHDVGLMRYVGDRETLDMVGLTTPNAADSWRNGPGAVAEFLINAPRRPDYFATYTTARGLDYLAESIFGPPLADFYHPFDPMTNVALGADYQGVFQPDWRGVEAASQPRVNTVRDYLEGLTLHDMLNVAELASEAAHGYQWRNSLPLEGFVSDVYLMDAPDCADGCPILDGGRRMQGGMEEFTLRASQAGDYVLVSRYNAPSGGDITVTVNGTYTVQRTVPSLPGMFVEVPTLIPRDVAPDGVLHIHITRGYEYDAVYPYRHWLYAGDYPENAPMDYPIVYQDGAVKLDVTTAHEDDALAVTLDWWTDGRATGDYIAFVHVYDDLNAPPVLQVDQRPMNGALPPGTWLPASMTERVILDTGSLPAGEYTLAVGMYKAWYMVRAEPDTTGEYAVLDSLVIIETFER